MKNYLAFYGHAYEAGGGMNDFLSDHDTLEDAKKALEDRIQKDKVTGRYKSIADVKEWRWGHVYGTKEQEILYEF